MKTHPISQIFSLFIIITFTVLIITIGALILIGYNHTFDKHISKITHDTLNFIEIELSEFISDRTELLNDIASNQLIVQAILTPDKALSQAENYLKFLKIAGRKYKTTLIDKNGNTLYGKTPEFNDEIENAFNNNMVSIHKFMLNNDNNFVLNIGVPIIHNDNVIGLLLEEFPITSIKDLLNWGHHINGNMKILLDNKEVLSLGTPLKKHKISHTHERFGIKLIYTADISKFVKNRNYLLLKVFTYSLILVIIIVIIVLSIGKKIFVDPVHHLENNMRQIIKGHSPDPNLPSRAVKELELLNNGINNMAKQIFSKQESLADMIETRTMALKESEEKFRSLVANLPGAIYRYTPSGEVLFVSDNIKAISGYSPEEIKRDKNLYPNLMDKKDFEEISKIRKQALKEHKPFTLEYRITSKSGKIKWIIEYGRGIIEQFNKLKYVDGAILDITKRKQVEYEREQLLKNLKNKTDELQSIVYVASHDLKTPLVNIQGFSKEVTRYFETLKESLSNKKIDPLTQSLLNENIPMAINYINSGVLKMKQLIDGLLQVSRIGTTNLDLKQIDVNKIIKDVIDIRNFQIKQKNVSIKVSSLPPCLGDENMINQLFSNLLDNAIKYLSPDRKGIIEIFSENYNNKSIYILKDNGIGMLDKHSKKIFELFYRLNPRDNVEGQGIGLTIVYRIINRLNGSIWVESEPDKGTAFFVSLPKE